jgi:putative oxidoreductase
MTRDFMNNYTPQSKLYRTLVAPFGIDWALLLYRLGLGALFASHGWGKFFSGAEGTIRSAEKMGFPLPELFGWAATLSEFAGGIMIMLGLLTRPWAALGAITMIVAAFIRHADDPWGKKELAVVYLVMMLVLFLTGPGRLSLDHLWFRKRESRI